MTDLFLFGFVLVWFGLGFFWLLLFVWLVVFGFSFFFLFIRIMLWLARAYKMIVNNESSGSMLQSRPALFRDSPWVNCITSDRASHCYFVAWCVPVRTSHCYLQRQYVPPPPPPPPHTHTQRKRERERESGRMWCCKRYLLLWIICSLLGNLTEFMKKLTAILTSWKLPLQQEQSSVTQRCMAFKRS